MPLTLPDGTTRLKLANPAMFLRTKGYFKDTLARGNSADVCVPMGLDWVDLSSHSPGAFEPVGIINGKVATRALGASKYSGVPYAPNPANVRGAEDYSLTPGTLVTGIGGAWRETGQVAQRVTLRWTGLTDPLDPAYGSHSEAAPGVHFVPGTRETNIGCWATCLPNSGVVLIGFVSDPPHHFGVYAYGTFPHVVGQEHEVYIETTGTHITAGIDGAQLPLSGIGVGAFGTGVNHGLSPISVATYAPWAIGSTKHGFTIDQHIVNYSGGAPSLTNLQAAPAIMSHITMTTPA